MASYSPGGASSNACTACLPSILNTDSAPNIPSSSQRISALISLSSTTRNRLPANSFSLFGPRASDSREFCHSSGMISHSSSTWNTEPFDTWLSTVSRPPIRSTSPLVILRPSPVPSTFSAAWLRIKGSNRLCWNSCVIPMPVSVTVKR